MTTDQRADKKEPVLQRLNRLVGVWTTEATHPAMPGTVVRGTAIIEWLEGGRFLIHRARTDHPDFPDSISIVGDTIVGTWQLCSEDIHWEDDVQITYRRRQ